MNLIDKYIEQVGDNLPRKDREDILKEIRSILEDMLENRSQSTGRPVDEAMMIEILKEYGTPKKVAASYLPPRYLIGPRLYPTFLLVLKLVLGIMALVVVVVTAVSLFQEPRTIEMAVELVGKKLLELLGSMLSVLGNVVFVFAIVEWALGQSKPENEETWDPRSLDDEVKTDIVKPWSQVPDIILTTIALLIFNIFASQFGAVVNNASGKQIFIPAISEVFYNYLPWLNLIWILSIGLNLALIRIGKWQTWSRWFEAGLNVGGMIVLIVMVSGPAIITDLSGRLAMLGPSGAQVAEIYSGIAIGMKALLIVLIFVPVIEWVEKGIHLIRKK
jgi:hypothetical protein